MLLNLSLVLLLSTCLLVVAQETITQSNRPDYCSLPPVMAGEKKCKGYIQKWTSNDTSATCVSYVYGGCNGTKNLFDTEGECQAACPSSVVPQRKQQADASAPPTSASGPSVHPHQYLLAVIINCLYSFLFLLTQYL